MALAVGTRLGSYEVLAPLGAGGMGEVYRARDTRLDRAVAIKVLASHLSSNPDFRTRFEREAKAISSLNHPHICTLYDVGHQDGTDYIVLELVEGETLADRLKKGSLPLDQTLKCGIEIADALDKAHRSGVIHRDLKPGNVMMTKAGSKLMDFGLAKRGIAGGGAGAVSALPTQEWPLTEPGSLLGTYQYMAPEQLEGRDADARADIWALGCVVYEMATGKQAFAGKGQARLISAILKDEPQPIAQLQPMTPPALDRLVKVCLAKDPDDRWQSAHDTMQELKWIAEGGAQAGGRSAVAARGRERLAWTIAALLVIATPALGFLAYRNRTEPPPRIVSSILPPERTTFASQGGMMALSPDGRELAFVAQDADGKTSLWLRALDAPAAQALPGTEGAQQPFWSPDGRFLGFFADTKLKKISIAEGAVEALADAPVPAGGTWNRSGLILFAPSARSGGPIYKIAATGGLAAPVTESKGVPQLWPSFLPDGAHFFYDVRGEQGLASGVYLGSLDSKDARLLLTDSFGAVCSSAHVLFWRDGNLRAQAFDMARLSLLGEDFHVAGPVAFHANEGRASFSASDNGLLSFGPVHTPGFSNLVWVDRSGNTTGVLGDPARYFSPRLAHDGRHVGVDVSDAITDKGDIWILDVARNVSSRLTHKPANESVPIWSPDNRQILFLISNKTASDFYLKGTGGAGTEELLFANDAEKWASDWSRDGRYTVFNSRTPGTTQTDIWLLSVADRKASPWLTTPFSERNGRISPDGRWIAYQSDETGRYEVYLQNFPQPGSKVRVSVAGGSQPMWRSDGTELYYLSADGSLMATPIHTGASLQAGTPQLLFRTRYRSPGAPAPYDVSADGQRFLLNQPLPEETASSISLVQNWTAGRAAHGQ